MEVFTWLKFLDIVWPRSRKSQPKPQSQASPEATSEGSFQLTWRVEVPITRSVAADAVFERDQQLQNHWKEKEISSK